MSDIAFRAVSTRVYTGETDEWNCARPSGVQEDDLLIAIFAASNGTTVDTAPSGWTYLGMFEDVDDWYGVDAFVYYRVAGDSEPTSYTWEITEPEYTNMVKGCIVAYSGCEPSDPIMGSTFDSFKSSSATLNFPQQSITEDTWAIVSTVMPGWNYITSDIGSPYDARHSDFGNGVCIYTADSDGDEDEPTITPATATAGNTGPRGAVTIALQPLIVQQFVQPGGIASAEVFGAPVVATGSVVIEPNGIVSEEALGSLVIFRGSVVIEPGGIDSEEAFGTPVIMLMLSVIQPGGIDSEEAFGTPALYVVGANQLQIVDAAGIAYSFFPVNWGYETTVHLALLIAEKENGQIGIYDQGTSRDYRTATFTVQYPAEDMKALHNIFRRHQQSRGYSVDLLLPVNSGMFLFGADKGDSGSFRARLLSLEHEGTNNGMWQYFTTQLTFLAEGYPFFSMPTEYCPEGTVQIGTIDELRFPPEFTNVNYRYNYMTNVSRGGTGYTVDEWETSDQYSSEITLVLNRKAAGALIHHIVNDIRGNIFRLYSVERGWMMGIDFSHADTSYFECKLANPEISIVHTRHNTIEISLQVILVRVVT